MRGEIIPIRDDQETTAKVVELRPDNRSFWERHKRTVGGVIGVITVGAALYAGIDYAAGDWAGEIADWWEDPGGIDIKAPEPPE